MKWIVFTLFLITTLFILIGYLRRRSITGRSSERKYFQRIARILSFQFVSDEYFVQLEGRWNEFPVIVLPYHFEGPGSITLIYLQTGVPFVDKNWIEPNLSLGRALVEWRRKSSFGFEVTGKDLPAEMLLTEIEKLPYPYVALTVPSRFSYSPLLQKSLESWKSFVVFIALDEGRKPAVEKITNALQDASMIARKLSLRDT